MRYNFGLYHWRRWLRLILEATGVFGFSIFIWQKTATRVTRLFAMAAAVLSALYATNIAVKLFQPLPWQMEEDIYADLGTQLPYNSADQALDIGCGTGRSLVGLAPYIPTSCSVTGVDLFNDQIILGNTPSRARANARKAGHAVTPVRGDATQLPFAANSQDIVTMCLVLHDLPAADAQRILREARRVCTPNGTIGIVELPIPHDDTSDPETYWQTLVTDAGFNVETTNQLPWKGDRKYAIITASPAEI